MCLQLCSEQVQGTHLGEKKEKKSFSGFAYRAVVFVQAGGGREPEQVHVLLVEVLAYAVFCLQEIVAEGNCSRTCTKRSSPFFFF